MVFAAYPFFASLKPNARSYENLQKIDLSDLKNGSYKLLYFKELRGFHGHYEVGVLIVRKLNGSFAIWKVPMRNGKVAMPDIHWWGQALYYCSVFGPTVVNGVIDESLPIKCHDDEQPEWWKKYWQWNIDGEPINKNVEAFEGFKGYFEGRYYVYKSVLFS